MAIWKGSCSDTPRERRGIFTVYSAPGKILLQGGFQ
jgi:hypothetical protein